MWNSNRSNFERNLAVVIGINNYQNGIHKLATAVNDATALADLLETDYNYQQVIRLFPPHGEATLESLKTLLSETLPKEIKPTEGDRLLFYFAGHGIARNSEDGPAGYLIPQDAHLGKLETFLPMRDLNTALSQLECHHLLVMLDCCFAGNFRWSSSRNVIPVPETIHREHYDRFIRCRAWQAITSAAHNQEAIDFLSDLRDGTNNSPHSPFALALIEGLKDIKADLTGDGVITAPELYLYLRDRLLSKDGYSELQTPGLWPLQKHDRGEFIFTLPGFQREQLKPAPPLNEDNNPYRGLQPYDEKHARFFFGRQELIEELYNKISSPAQSSSQLIAVLGISGSGKSSLVKAGLIPYLRKNCEKEWQILEPMRPGKSPFIALANTMLAIANVPSDANSHYFKQLIRDFKQGNSQQLIETIAAWSKANPQVKLLLTIDQFEELITMSRKASSANPDTKSDLIKQKPQDWLSRVFSRQSTAKNNNQTTQEGEIQQEWQRFLVLLINTLKNCPQLHIVLTLRSDFEARFVESALKEYWDKARFPVRAMRSDELREAIEKPASEMALYFEPANAVDRLIDEVGEMPGALPLLSFTLSEFYIKLHQAWSEKRKEDRAVTVDEQFYQQGGIGGSLTYRANEIYNKLPNDAHRDTMRRVMLRMVTLEGGEPLRRQVSMSELNYPKEVENKRRDEVIDRLVKARLLIKGREKQKVYVEPAHDYLVQGWDKLQEWINQDRQALSLQRRLTPAAFEWERNKQTRFLWNADPYLDVLKQVLKSEKNNWFNEVEAKFVRESVKQKNKNVTLRWNLASLAFLTLSGFTLAIFIRLQLTELGEKVGRVKNILPNQPLDGLVLAIQATGQSQSILKPFLSPAFGQVQSSLKDAIEAARERNVLVGNGTIDTVAISPNGQYIAASITHNNQASMRVWDLKGNSISDFRVTKGAESITFSPNGQKLILLYDWGRLMQLWDIQGNLISNFPLSQESVKSVTFSSQGNMIITALENTSNKSARIGLWNPRGELIKSFPVPQETIKSVAINQQNNMIVTSSTGSDNLEKIQVWDLNGKLIRDLLLSDHDADIISLVFSPDGNKIVGTNFGSKKTVLMWNIRGNSNNHGDFSAQIEGIKSEGTTDQDVSYGSMSTKSIVPANNFAAFTTDGRIIISVSDISSSTGRSQGNGSTLRLWNRNAELIEQILFPELEAIAVDREGKYVVTGNNASDSDQWQIKLWDVQGNALKVFSGHYYNVNKVAVSSDGRMIASGGDDGTLRLWDLQGNFISIKSDESKVKSVAISSNGQVINTREFSGDRGKAVVEFRDLQGKPIGKPFVAYEGDIDSLAISSDGNTIVTTGKDNNQVFADVRLWDRQGNLTKIAKTFSGGGSKLGPLAITFDGQTIVSTSEDGNAIRLLDRHGNQIGQLFRGHSNTIEAVAISPDGQAIVSGSQDKTLRLWNRQGNQIGQPLQNPLTSSVSISPILEDPLQGNVQYIVTGNGNGTVALWDRQGNLIGEPLKGHKALVSSIAISSDGNFIVSGSNDSTVRLWRLGTWKTWLDIACERLRYHPVLNDAERLKHDQVAREARKTCQKYTWK